MNYLRDYDSVIGKILLACDDEGLTGLWFENQKYYGRGLSDQSIYQSHPFLDEAVSWLDLYFSGRDPGFTPPLNPNVSPFQKEVLRELLKIPYGKTVTYGDIAREISAAHPEKRTSARAVGNAVGRNPVSIIIPCHRVIGADGKLTGYAGGLQRKTFLLDLEQKNRQNF